MIAFKICIVGNIIANSPISLPFLQNKVNGMLRERWDNLSKDDKEIWKKWEVWDSKRYKRDVVVFQKRPTNLTQGVNQTHDADLKKRKKDNSSAADSKSAFQIPKKKRSIE